MEERLKYNGCQYTCYSKYVKTRSGGKSRRVYCRRDDPKCVIGKRIPLWQMTLQEYLDSDQVLTDFTTIRRSAAEKTAFVLLSQTEKLKRARKFSARIHRMEVEEAIKQKRSLRPEVLADYPELTRAKIAPTDIIFQKKTLLTTTNPDLVRIMRGYVKVLPHVPRYQLDQKKQDAIGYLQAMQGDGLLSEMELRDATRAINQLRALILKTPVKPAPEKPKPQVAPTIQRPGPKDAARLRKAADAMTKTIEAKRNPAIAEQRITARRAGIAAGMSDEADYLQTIQTQLHTMASMMDSGTLPALLWKVTSKADIERIRSYARQREPKVPTQVPPAWSYAPQIKVRERDIRAFEKMGIQTTKQLLEAAEILQAMLSKPTPEQQRQKKLAEIERGLIGRKIPGYFPTPKAIVERMLDKANIQPGMTVLEPSAGKGDIADAIRKQHPRVDLSVIEINPTLRDILLAKRHKLVGDDFFKHTTRFYNRIIQNPPFEGGLDIQHVYYAYGRLTPGGRLVSLMSEGPFFKQDKASQDFRKFLDETGYSEKLPPKSFLSSDRPTGVQARMVVIDKK